MKDWKKVKLGSLLTESKIVSEKPNTNRRLRVRLNMLGVEKRPNVNDKEGATKYYVRKAGQFIYGKQNLHKGAFGIIPEELDGFESSSDIPAFDVDESCYSEWIYYFFKKGNFYSRLEGVAKGVGAKRIQPHQIFELDIYLPTKDEQKEILEDISNIEIKYKTILMELEYQENKLPKLRQYILDKAVNGGLSQKWRNENPTEKIAEDFFVSFCNKKNTSKNSERLVLTSIPNTWKYCQIADLIDDMESGKSPQCENRSARIDEWGVLKTTSVQNLYFLEKENKALLNHEKVNKNIEVKIGDVLITRAGPQNRVGITTYINETRDKLLLSDKIIRIKYLPDLVMGKFLAISLSAGISASYLSSKKTGMSLSQVNISQVNIRQTPLLLPPLNEQRIIVNKVEKTLEACDAFEFEVKMVRQASEQIIQSTLSKLLGEENPNILIEKNEQKVSYYRKSMYDNKTTLMELIDLLKKHGKLHAEDLWKMSKHYNDKNISDSIDEFYADLKKNIEIDKTIKEVVDEKGYLELV